MRLNSLTEDRVNTVPPCLCSTSPARRLRTGTRNTLPTERRNCPVIIKGHDLAKKISVAPAARNNPHTFARVLFFWSSGSFCRIERCPERMGKIKDNIIRVTIVWRVSSNDA